MYYGNSYSAKWFYTSEECIIQITFIESNRVRETGYFVFKVEFPLFVSILLHIINELGMPIQSTPSITTSHNTQVLLSPVEHIQNFLKVWQVSLKVFLFRPGLSMAERFSPLQHAPENHLNATNCAEPLDPTVGPLAFDILWLILSSSFLCPYLLELPCKLLVHSWTLSTWRKGSTSGNRKSCSCLGSDPVAKQSLMVGASHYEVWCRDPEWGQCQIYTEIMKSLPHGYTNICYVYLCETA